MLLLPALSGAISSVASAQSPGGKVVVLDTSGFWRMHHTLSEPVIRFDDGLKPVVPAGEDVKGWTLLLAKPTAGAPQGWAEPNFDDSLWYRGTGAAICRTPYLQRLCVRGVFNVTDPQRARGLELSLDFYGGAAVYLNGKEIARQSLKAPPAGAEALADDYPLEAFVKDDGTLIALRGGEALVKKDSAGPETLKRIEQRTRKLEVPLPAAALRKGVNVLAVEIVRAPYHKVLDSFKVRQTYKSNELTNDMSWNTCDLRRIQLTAAAADGLVPGATRPDGIQVWNSDPLGTDFDMDFAGPAEALGPIRLAGAINGVYSGKVVVGSKDPIQGLKAAAGDLSSDGGGKIPAAQIRIRYGLPWGNCRTSTEGCFDTTAYAADAKPLWALVEAPLAEFPVYEKKPPVVKLPGDTATIVRGGLELFYLSTPGQPAPVNGAVVAVWVTVKVPKDAKPGVYKGQVALQAGGRTLADVPVELQVADWAVPDPDNYATWVDLVQSPDVLSLEYNAPLWSDKHFDLIAKSMKFLGEVGSRMVYVPLIAYTNLGNAESMVRWIKKGENKYDYDFTAMEKYLDVAEKNMGKPKVVELNVWDLYTFQEGGKVGRFVGGASGYKGGERGPLVTVLDPATGKTEAVQMPTYADPVSKDLWKPLFAQLRERMKKRGLEGAMMLGMTTDDWPSKAQVQFFQDIGADLSWFSDSHGRHDGDKSLYGIAGVGYQAHAFNVDVAYTGTLRGWSIPRANTLYERWGGFPNTMVTRYRAFAEYAVTGNTRGVGRVGADYWQAVKDKNGQRKGFVWERYPEASWHQLSLVSSVLAPGPDSAVATPKFEAIREGVQDAEAIIQIERALADKAQAARLGPDLAKKAQDVLDEHHRAMWISVATLQVGPAAEHAFSAWRGCYFAGVNGYRWFQGSDWQQRNERLYALAGEVARKLGGK
jgi:hypothetical protein